MQGGSNIRFRATGYLVTGFQASTAVSLLALFDIFQLERCDAEQQTP